MNARWIVIGLIVLLVCGVASAENTTNDTNYPSVKVIGEENGLKILQINDTANNTVYILKVGGYIVSASPTTLEAGKTTKVTIKIYNYGDAGTLVVEPISIPSGWSVDDGEWDLDNAVKKYVKKGEYANFNFYITPPKRSEEKDIKFRLSYEHGICPFCWHEKLDEKSFRFKSVKVNHPPNIPTLYKPRDGATVNTLTPTFSWSKFSDPDSGDYQKAFQLRIWEAPGPNQRGTKIVLDKVYYSSSNSVTPSLSDYKEKLKDGKWYHWHVRVMDNHGAWSNWAADTPSKYMDFKVERIPTKLKAYDKEGFANNPIKLECKLEEDKFPWYDIKGRIVKFYLTNGQYLGCDTTDSDGKAYLSKTFSTGTYYYYCKFEGDNKYKPSKSNNAKIVVKSNKGNLKISIKNVDGKVHSEWGKLRVILYDTNWKPIKTKITDSRWSVEFTGLSQGKYYYEVYTKWNDEFWGSGSATVEAGKTESATFTRKMPYLYSLNPKGDQIEDVESYFILKVHSNKASDYRLKDYRVTIYFDRNKKSPYDFTKTVKGTLSSGVVSKEDYWIPPSSGTYYYKAKLEVWIRNKWVKTDECYYNWPKYGYVKSNKGNLKISIKNVDGKVHSEWGKLKVNLYDANWRHIDTKITDYKWTVTFTNLKPGKYYFDVWTTWNGEFWGGGTAKVEAEKTKQVKFTRSAPYFCGLYPKGEQVEGKKSYFILKVNAQSWHGNKYKVKLIFDRNRKGPYDYEKSIEGVLKTGVNEKTDYWIPPSPGKYYYKAILYVTLSNGKTVKTDEWVWNEYGNVKPKPRGNLLLQIYNIDGKVHSEWGELKVILSDKNWNHVDTKTTYKWKVKFNKLDLDLNPYHFGVYTDWSNSWGYKEYWGEGIVNIKPGDNSIKWTRNTPVFLGLDLGNPKEDEKTKFVARFKCLGYKKYSGLDWKARIIIDKDKKPPYDFDKVYSGRISKESWAITDYWTPKGSGKYYYKVLVQMRIKHGWRVTDGWDWVEFNVKPKLPYIDITGISIVSPKDKRVLAGENITVKVSYKNNGGSGYAYIGAAILNDKLRYPCNPPGRCLLPWNKTYVNKDQSGSITLKYKVPDDAPEGYYDVIVCSWDKCWKGCERTPCYCSGCCEGKQDCYTLKNAFKVVREKIVDEGEAVIPFVVYTIIYDPPGDNSYSFIEKTTTTETVLTLTAKMNLESEIGLEVEAVGTELDTSIGARISKADSKSFKITIEEMERITSAPESDDPEVIGPGRGDVFIGEGWKIKYWIKKVAGGKYVLEYQPVDATIDISKEYGIYQCIMKAYDIKKLPEPLRSKLLALDLAYGNKRPPDDKAKLIVSKKIHGDITDEHAKTITISGSRSIEFEIEVKKELATELGLKILGEGAAGKVRVAASLEVGHAAEQSYGESVTVGYHLEDDEQDDHITMYIYQDLAYGTYLFIVDEEQSRTSLPHEHNTIPRDTIKPEIYNVYPEEGSTISTSSVTIYAYYRDPPCNDGSKGTGIDMDSVKLMLDGKPVPAEIYEDHVSYDAEYLSFGKHEVYLTVSDREGNVAEKTWTFEIVDEEPPTIINVMISPEGEIKIGDDVTITAVIKDEGSGLDYAKIVYKMNSEEREEEMICIGESCSVTIENVQGDIYYKIYAYDKAGNEGKYPTDEKWVKIPVNKPVAEIEVTPENIKVTVKAGESIEKIITVREVSNEAGTGQCTVEKANNIEWITVTPDTFSLNPGEEITLTLKISPPKDIVSGEYTEYLLITGENIRGQKSVEITVEVSAKYRLTVRTSGLKDNMTKVWINDKFYGFVNDTQPLEVSLNSGEYIVKVEQYVYDDARMTRYNCTKPEDTINLNSDKEITFYYKSEYKLIIKAQPENGGKVEVNPDKVWFRENEEVTLKATPNEGFEFKEWRIYPYGLKCNDSKCFFTRKENPTKINMDRTKTVVAIFNPIKKEPPIAKFDFIPKAPQVGQEITFDASSSYDPDGTIILYKWDFGDGTTGSGVTVNHTYSQPGTYTVTLTLTDNDGLTNSTSKIIKIVNTTIIAPSGIIPPNGTKMYNIMIANAKKIVGINLTMYYDQSVIRVVEVKAIDPKSQVYAEINNTIGVTSIALINTNTITTKTPKPIINVTFKAVGNCGSSTPINLSAEVSSEDFKPVKANVINGSITVRVKGDFNGNCRVDIGDVCYVAYMVIGKIKPDPNADFNNNGRIDIGDLAKIAYYLIGKIDKL